MCHLARQPAAQPEEGSAPSVPGSQGLRPRWAGVAAVAAVTGLALAALVAPSPTAPSLPRQQAVVAPAVPAAPKATRTLEMPTATTVERIVLGDDGMVTTPETARAGITPCHEEL